LKFYESRAMGTWKWCKASAPSMYSCVRRAAILLVASREYTVHLYAHVASRGCTSKNHENLNSLVHLYGLNCPWQVRAWHQLRAHRWQTPPPSLPYFQCTAVMCRHSPARARLRKGESTPAAAQLLDAQERLQLATTGHGMRS
jgi:hypothetical protein